jgi:hypothetical protein
MAAFDQIYAVDPNNSENVAENGVISIYAPGTRTLLALKTVMGGPLPNPLQLNSRGFGPAFIADGYTLVAWEAVAPGEVFQGTFKSYEGVLEQATAAKAQAAEGAAAELAQRIAVGEFNGSDGKDGSNVLPTAAAVAQAITTPGSAANTALSATFATKTVAPSPFANLARTTAPRWKGLST